MPDLNIRFEKHRSSIYHIYLDSSDFANTMRTTENKLLIDIISYFFIQIMFLIKFLIKTSSTYQVMSLPGRPAGGHLISFLLAGWVSSAMSSFQLPETQTVGKTSEFFLPGHTHLSKKVRKDI